MAAEQGGGGAKTPLRTNYTQYTLQTNIYREFFSQGDLEKAMGARPIPMMDREQAFVPKLQIEFYDSIAIPIFE